MVLVLSLVSVLWLLNSAIGARVAVKEGLPAEWVAGVYVGQETSAEFFKGTGTALSPGLPMMVMETLFAMLSTRGGRAGTAGAAGLTVLGVGSCRRGPPKAQSAESERRRWRWTKPGRA